MPATRLTDAAQAVTKYDILATSHQTDDGLLLHAVLYNDEPQSDVTNQTVLKTFHMGPPLGPLSHRFDAAGTCNLTDEQAAKIEEFIDRQWADKRAEKKRLAKLALWDARAQYRIQPPYSRPRKGSSLTRYSCVGFVLLAYKKARIQLLSGPAPLKTIEELKDLYPSDFHPMLDDEATRKDFGLREGYRWPVVLVGYVMHAMNRPDEEINGEKASPYTPQEGDEYFPHKPTVTDSGAGETT